MLTLHTHTQIPHNPRKLRVYGKYCVFVELVWNLCGILFVLYGICVEITLNCIMYIVDVELCGNCVEVMLYYTIPCQPYTITHKFHTKI